MFAMRSLVGLAVLISLGGNLASATDGCSSFTNCDTCTNSPGNGCGWCVGTDTCVAGSSEGPKSGTCTQYIWDSDTCPIQCSTITSCSTCINSQDSITGQDCGWCSANNKCSTSDDSCTDSDNNWYTYNCPTKPPTTCGNYNASCSACSNITGCSWCETSNFCAFFSNNNYDSCPGGSSAVTSYGSCPKPCESITDCYDCATTSDRCGWCDSTKKCINGGSSGPFVGTCPSTDWKWEPKNCPVYCSAKANCSDCLSDRNYNKCGWCSSLNACIPTRPSDRNEPEGNCPTTDSGLVSHFHTSQSNCPLNCTAYNTDCKACQNAVGRVQTDSYGYWSWTDGSCLYCPEANNGKGQCAFYNNVSKTNVAADQCGTSYCKAHCQKYTDEQSCLNYDDSYTCQWCPISGVCGTGSGSCGSDQWISYLPNGGGGDCEENDDCSDSGAPIWVYLLGGGGGFFCLCVVCCTCRAINRSQTNRSQTIYTTPQPTYTTFSSKPKKKKKVIRYVEGMVDGKKTMVIQEDEVTDEE